MISMSMQDMVERITDLVMQRLEKARFGIASQKSAQTGFLKNAAVLLCGNDIDESKLIAELNSASSLYKYSFFPDNNVPEELVIRIASGFGGKVYFELPQDWKALVAGMDVVVIPFLTISLCSKLAALIPDGISAQIALRALLEQKSVYAASDEIIMLKSLGNKVSKPVIRFLSDNFEKMLSLGVKEISLSDIAKELSGARSSCNAALNGGVITKEDMEAAVKSGTAILYFSRGTIITPLARDYAESLNIQIVFK